MKHARCFWLFFLLFSVQALEHSSISAAKTPSFPSFPSLSQQNNPWARNSSSVSSDFDGDNKPDLAIGRFEGRNYNIEFQLTTQPSHISLASRQTELSVYLLVCDVDLDNDQDLVLVSYTSLLPQVVWLNDGKANFEEGSRWLWLNLNVTDNTSSVDPESFSASAVSITENYRLPLDRSVTGFLGEKLQPRNSVVHESPTLRLSFFPCHRHLRGPPHSS